MIIIISMFFLRTKFHKNRAHWNSETKSVQVFNFGSRSAGLRIYFIFGTKLSWNEGIDTCFNVECVLVGRNFDFLGRYLVLTASYLVLTARYRSHFQYEWNEWNGSCSQIFLNSFFNRTPVNGSF